MEIAETRGNGSIARTDLGRIVDPQSPLDKLAGVQTGKTVVHLDLEVEPGTGSHLLPPEVDQIHLRIAAANVHPVEKQIEVTIQGEWFSDRTKMFTDGIGLRELN